MTDDEHKKRKSVFGKCKGDAPKPTPVKEMKKWDHRIELSDDGVWRKVEMEQLHSKPTSASAKAIEEAEQLHSKPTSAVGKTLAEMVENRKRVDELKAYVTGPGDPSGDLDKRISELSGISSALGPKNNEPYEASSAVKNAIRTGAFGLGAAANALSSSPLQEAVTRAYGNAWQGTSEPEPSSTERLAESLGAFPRRTAEYDFTRRPVSDAHSHYVQRFPVMRNQANTAPTKTEQEKPLPVEQPVVREEEGEELTFFDDEAALEYAKAHKHGRPYRIVREHDENRISAYTRLQNLLDKKYIYLTLERGNDNGTFRIVNLEATMEGKTTLIAYHEITPKGKRKTSISNFRWRYLLAVMVIITGIILNHLGILGKSIWKKPATSEQIKFVIPSEEPALTVPELTPAK